MSALFFGLLLACGPKTTPPDLISFDVSNSAIPEALSSDDPELRSLAYGGLTATASAAEMNLWWPKFADEPDSFYRQRGLDALFAEKRHLDKIAELTLQTNLGVAERCRLIARLHLIGYKQSFNLSDMSRKPMSARLNCALANAVVNQDLSELSLLLKDATLVTELPFYWALQSSRLSLNAEMTDAHHMAEESYRMSLLGAWLVLHPDSALAAMKKEMADYVVDDRMELIDFLWRVKKNETLPAIRILSEFKDRGGEYARLLLFAMTGKSEKETVSTLLEHRDWEMRALAADAVAYRIRSFSSSDTLRIKWIGVLKKSLSEKDGRALAQMIRSCGHGNVWELASEIARLGVDAPLPIRLEIESALRYFAYNRRLQKEKHL